MPKWSVCTSCPTLHTGKGKCPDCRAASDKTRRPNGNPYRSKGHLDFRTAVLRRDPMCVLCGDEATVADHYPRERKELIELGLDPNCADYGRGLCFPCHSKITAQQYGWGKR